MDKILKYITQIDVSKNDKCVERVFHAPNLQVIAYDNIRFDEYVKDGLHVVFSRGLCGVYNSLEQVDQWLDKLPSMSYITLTAYLHSDEMDLIFNKLPKWSTLQDIYFKDRSLPKKQKLQAFIRSYGVYTNYPELEEESIISCDLKGSIIWTILSSNVLQPELLRMVVEMLDIIY